ncbi:putative inactive nicotinamidase [Chlorella sorokiniana]|uniref:Inactive nicotinamidase n=1 Tax=Chlorella sorokiniana TaxID=3076 RepID=A0A2P6TYY4_CHLSO|nr:putative inactive nicotinamidase [Chlorella sorokiniana]|eukprot:PRW59276.1 putative inactive nicotinamidase [Chlorella sorokiniana]
MFREGKASTVPGTTGVQLVEPLAAAPGERVVVKKRFSAFFNTELDMVLRRMGVQDVVIAGVQTPNCIRGTAWDALALDYPRVTVLADATASRSEAVQAANLEDMRCASVLTPSVAEWAAQL